MFPTDAVRHQATEMPDLEAVTEQAASGLADYRCSGSLPVLAAADEGARRIAAMLHDATETGRGTVWLQVARYAVELVAVRYTRPPAGREYTLRDGIFGDGIALEVDSPKAHNAIMSASRHLAYADRYGDQGDHERAAHTPKRPRAC
ncbi:MULTISPECIES: hypothetical protein [unclassified Streptomyces]|uniref:hypothetical protein n=1 Tax=unclassified Streptomyces TaxID=2593676 RepID=UPI0033CC9F21